MKLDQVQIKQFRNIELLSFNPDKKLNIFYGENGSGKSSILEALHYLGFARSFRTAKHKNVIQNGKSEFTVFCHASTAGGESKKFGISRSVNDSCLVNVDGVKSKRATDLASHLPIQIFTPQSSDLMLGPPKSRRRYLDWLLFHVEHSFNADFQIYTKCLKHINALYKSHASEQALSYWYTQLNQKGNSISAFRENILNDSLTELIKANLTEFLPEFCFEITYYRGWEKGYELAESITKNSQKDKRNGFLSVGPHKAELRIKINGVLAHEVLSRGQLRMLVAAMQLAQTQFFHAQTSKSSIFLLDDIGAELDEDKRKVFIAKLNTAETQLFVSAIEHKQLGFLANNNDKKVFHVEHGQVREEY